MQEGLVSVLTPAYNTAGYIHRLLDSVLGQTYPQIEMIVVDDGSTDNLAEVVKSYEFPFTEKGFSFLYIYQENSGQSTAIKNGLPHINGEFLVWPDSDDYYSSFDAITLMVEEFLHSPEELHIVRTQGRIVKDGTLEPISTFGLNAKRDEPKTLFEDCLFGKNGFFYCPGAYMVRTKTLYELTKFDIFTTKDAGQNWQMELPFLYHYRCRTILQPLYHVVKRSHSHTRGQYIGYEALSKKTDAFLATAVETVKRIEGLPSSVLIQYEHRLTVKYYRKALNFAILFHRRKAAQERMQMVRSVSSHSTVSDQVITLLLMLKGGTYMAKAYQKTIRSLKKVFR